LNLTAQFSNDEATRPCAPRGWLQFWGLPQSAIYGDYEAAEAVRRLYKVLDRMPEGERIAFASRFVQGMTVAEVADASGVSRATIERTLTRAEIRFVAGARRDAVLRRWLERSTLWSGR
jgi:RNA polymerase sigma-70 factor (ECF subfamily)